MPNLTNSQEPVEAGCFWLMEPEPEPLEKKPGAGAGAAWEENQEPEHSRLKKVRTRARAAKKFAGSPALRSIHSG